MGGSRAAVFLSFLVLQPGMLFLTSHLTPHTSHTTTTDVPIFSPTTHCAYRSAFGVSSPRLLSSRGLRYPVLFLFFFFPLSLLSCFL